VSLKSNLVVFDLKGLEDLPPAISAVMLQTVSSFVWNMVWRPRSEMAWVIYDECWAFLRHRVAAELQEMLYRTARKMNVGVMSVTQRLEDFLAVPTAQAILANTSTLFLLKAVSNHDAVAQALSLNERETHLFKSLTSVKGKFSEMLVRRENGSAVCRLYPSPYEYWVNTTDPRDRALEREELARNRGDRLLALRELATKYPRGAAGGARKAA
jgi:conjugal transfer ATP-binding protein TraC